MKNKNSKSGVIATLVIYFVLIAILSVCTFAIPFPKLNNGVIVTSYVCSATMIIAEGSLTLFLLFKEENADQKILGFPIIFFGYVALILQFLSNIVFYICNAFIELQIWIVILVEALLYGFFIVQIAKGFFFKNRNVEYHERIANTKFMDEFRAKLKVLVLTNKNENINKELEDLLDTANGSDPVTNEKTIDIEKELSENLLEIEKAIKFGSDGESRILIEKIKNTLLERNALCKIGK